MSRYEGAAGEFGVVVGPYALTCVPDGLPSLFDRYSERAQLCDRFDLESKDRCCVVVRRVADTWPFLVVAQGFYPVGAGFEPGLLLDPERHRLFIGAGERIVAYDLCGPRRLWVDAADTGFWGWAQHGDVIVMSAELELAAWTAEGEKLWTTFVEPPWTYRVEGPMVLLDVMGQLRSFPLRGGPLASPRRA